MDVTMNVAGTDPNESVQPAVEAPDLPLQISGFGGRRGSAQSFDTFAVGAILFAGSKLIDSIFGTGRSLIPIPVSPVGGAQFAFVVLVCVVWFAAVPATERWRGQTFGKLRAGVVVVGEDGGPIGARRAFLRGLITIVPALSAFGTFLALTISLDRPGFVVLALTSVVIVALADDLLPVLVGRARQTGHDLLLRTVVVEARSAPTGPHLLGGLPVAVGTWAAAGIGIFLVAIGFGMAEQVEATHPTPRVVGRTQTVTAAQAPDGDLLRALRRGLGSPRIASEADAQRIVSVASMRFAACMKKVHVPGTPMVTAGCTDAAHLGLAAAYAVGRERVRIDELVPAPGTLRIVEPRSKRKVVYFAAQDPSGHTWGYAFRASGRTGKFCLSGPVGDCHDVTGLASRQAWLQDEAHTARVSRRMFAKAGLGCVCRRARPSGSVAPPTRTPAAPVTRRPSDSEL